MIKLGYKILRVQRSQLWSWIGAGVGQVRYQVGKWAYPKKGCGPLCVYSKNEDVISKKVHDPVYYCQVKVYSKEMSAFFDNGIGDGSMVVRVYPKVLSYEKQAGADEEFIGHFTVREPKSVFLSGYDCDDEPLYTFGIGRWFVYRPKGGVIVIALLEKDALDS